MTPAIARLLLPSVTDVRERENGALRVPRAWVDAGGVRANLAAPGASGPAGSRARR